MKVLLLLCLVATGAFALPLPADWKVDLLRQRDNGDIRFISGELGLVKGEINEQTVREYFASVSDVYGLVGSETFNLKRTNVDRSGSFHFHFTQINRHLEVDGAFLIIHVRADGSVFAITSSLLVDSADAEYNNINNIIDGRTAITQAAPVATFTIETGPTLVYLMHEDGAHLAFRAEITYQPKDQNYPTTTQVFARADSGALVVEFPKHIEALNRTVYNANHTIFLPGTSVMTEGDPQNIDPVVNDAYNNSGVCYDFYKTKFNRDSWDGHGAAMLSTVHYFRNFNNAFWNGKQMVYGDGDNKTFSNFAGDLSVVCHELTHAVVETTANLRYSGQSGALNEGYADIMGASAVAFHQGCLTTWMIGPKCYLAGAALRYMNNPTMDGSSRDYYPERYTGILDNGGVHWNSGIANLAYVLTVGGGVHPRQKTSIWVEPIGLDKAEQIYYNALVNYMGVSTNFAEARDATITAAKELYGEIESLTVANAWTAVGVPASSTK